MSQIKKNTDQYMNNLKLQLKLSEMGVSSWGSSNDPTSGFTREANRVINSPYDKEMIESYMQEEQNKPPIEMNGKTYKYEPFDDTLDSTQHIEDEIDKTAQEIDALQTKLLSDIDRVNRIYTDVFVQRSEDEYNKALVALDTFMNAQSSISPGGASPQKKMKQLEKNVEATKKDYNVAVYRRKLYLNRIQKYTEEIEQASRYIEHLKTDIKKVQDANKNKVSEYKDALVRKGHQGTPDQLPGEDNVAYIQRVNETAEATGMDSEYTKTKAYLTNIEKFKNNFKQLTRNDVFIQQVLNEIQSGYDPEGNLFKLNQKFPIFKDDYLKVYGFNNNNVSLDDIGDVINVFIEEDKLPSWSIDITKQPPLLLNNPTISSAIVPLRSGSPPPSTPIQPISLSSSLTLTISPRPAAGAALDPDVVYFKVINSLTTLELSQDGRDVYLCYGDIPKVGSKVFWSETGAPSTWQSINLKVQGSELYTILQHSIGMTSDQFRDLGFGRLNVSNEAIIKTLKTEFGMVDNYRGDFNVIKKVGNYKIHGMGIKPSDIHKVVHFGLVSLFLHKLYYKNILSIQNQKGLKIAGFKNTPVSDAFVNCVMKLIDRKDLSASDIHSLKSSEKELFDNLLHVAGLHKKNITGSTKDSIETVKKRLELVEGEIEAGNNNTELKRELYDLLFRLVHFHVISEKQARSHYKLILKQFFDK